MKRTIMMMVAILATALAFGQAEKVKSGPGAGVRGTRVTPIASVTVVEQPAADDGQKQKDENAESRAIYQASVSNVLAAVGYIMKTPAPMMDAATRIEVATLLNKAADKLRAKEIQ